jgi:GNAT superfamily N-acetyltransferase
MENPFLDLTLDSARCRVWWGATPSIEGERVGLIGNYESADSPEACAILDLACQHLRAQGVTLVLGPMDGSTWRRYRWVAEGAEKRTPYFLEPANPAYYIPHWQQAGFAPFAWYNSAFCPDIRSEDPRVERVWARLESQGFRLRSVDMARWEEELGALYRFSLEAFADNFLYTPISEAEFRAQYSAVKPYVHPGLVWVVERQGEICAFLFAIPDHLEPQRGQTLIIKTVAAHPRFRRQGLGSILTWHAHRTGAQLGYTQAIHALMYEENESTRISGRHAEVFRRYALYSRSLR